MVLGALAIWAFAIVFLLLREGVQEERRIQTLSMAQEGLRLIQDGAAAARSISRAEADRATERAKLAGIADRLARNASFWSSDLSSDRQLRSFVARLRVLAEGGDAPLSSHDPKIEGVLVAVEGALRRTMEAKVAAVTTNNLAERAGMRNVIAAFIVLGAGVIGATLIVSMNARRHEDSPLEAALESLREGVAIFGPDDRLVLSNPQFGRHLNAASPPRAGMTFAEFASALADNADFASDVEREAWLADRLVRHRAPAVPTAVEPDKEYLSDGRCLEIAEYRTNDGGSILLMRDVTEAERREAVRMVRDERTHAIVETVFDGIIMINDEGIVETFNPAAEKIFGVNGTDIIGQNVKMLMPAGYSEYHDGYLQRYLNGGEPKLIGSIRELQGLRRDGTVFPLEIAVNEVNATWILQERRRTPRRVFIATLRDVTEQKELSRQLQQSQKMEAIGTLAGGIAHDFNNILSIILGYTGLTVETTELDEEASENLDMVMQAGVRARDLVDQILTFSRRGEQEKMRVEMQPAVKEALKLLRSTLPATVEIRHEADAEPIAVMADPTQLHQVLMNLCTNAGQAMENGGILEVKLERVELSSEEAAALGMEGVGAHAKLSVRDTGVGMDTATLERVFEPFYTTKAPGQGTGLGLAVVHGIVTEHGGAINAESAPGAGSNFSVLLPMAPDDEIQAVETTLEAPTGEGRILFVDDEPAVVRMGEKLLGRLGYTVRGETSSVQALRTFRAEPAEFDLVVTDQTMPEMTGETLSREIRRIRADVPIIVCTGFSRTFTPEKAREAGIDGYVMKASLAADLGGVVHDVLSKSRLSV